jgi:hypothetical protein
VESDTFFKPTLLFTRIDEALNGSEHMHKVRHMEKKYQPIGETVDIER